MAVFGQSDRSPSTARSETGAASATAPLCAKAEVYPIAMKRQRNAITTRLFELAFFVTVKSLKRAVYNLGVCEVFDENDKVAKVDFVVSVEVIACVPGGICCCLAKGICKADEV